MYRHCRWRAAPAQEISTSLKELLNWNLIRVSRRAGNLCEYFEASSDVWELPCTIVRERKRREFAPTSAMLNVCEF